MKFLIGGGSDGAGAILKDADDAGYTNVFGLTDRDFRPSNVADWTNPANTFRKFVLPVHEVENYLLDALAFAGKEILRDVAGWMCDRTAIPRFPSTDVGFYADLAKAIARWQVANNAVPADLANLLAALKARVAPPPSVP